MYLILKDQKLSGLTPGHVHYIQVRIEGDEPAIRARICRAGYVIVHSNPFAIPDIPVRDWQKMPRIK
jgi:hypothetical protein